MLTSTIATDIKRREVKWSTHSCFLKIELFVACTSCKIRGTFHPHPPRPAPPFHIWLRGLQEFSDPLQKFCLDVIRYSSSASWGNFFHKLVYRDLLQTFPAYDLLAMLLSPSKEKRDKRRRRTCKPCRDHLLKYRSSNRYHRGCCTTEEQIPVHETTLRRRSGISFQGLVREATVPHLLHLPLWDSQNSQL